jgi:hypothetical protein
MNTKTATIINIVNTFNTLCTASFINNLGGVYSFETIEKNSMNYL